MVTAAGDLFVEYVHQMSWWKYWILATAVCVMVAFLAHLESGSGAIDGQRRC
jgi:hypothetical protein